MSDTRIRRDLRWGVTRGLAIAVAYGAWVTAVRLTKGTAPFEREGVAYPAVVAAYFGTGALAGALVGALRPLTAGRVGAYGVGLLSGLIIACGLGLLTGGAPARWDYARWLTVPIYGILAGAFVGNELWKASDARESPPAK